MGDLTEVTGIVLSAMPVGEFDRRIVILTKEKGKISAFAKGARKPNSPLVGVTRPFVFGSFSVYEGKTSYNIRQANISNYFEDIAKDLDAVCYACYFAELADYYGRENLEAAEMIQLLYVTLKALLNKHIPDKLVRYIYELKLIAMNGEAPEVFTCHNCGSDTNIDTYSMFDSAVFCKNCHGQAKDGVPIAQSTLYTLQFILTQPLAHLYSFTVSEEVLVGLRLVLGRICAKTFDKPFKSEQMLP